MALDEYSKRLLAAGIGIIPKSIQELPIGHHSQAADVDECFDFSPCACCFSRFHHSASSKCSPDGPRQHPSTIYSAGRRDSSQSFGSRFTTLLARSRNLKRTHPCAFFTYRSHVGLKAETRRSHRSAEPID